MPAALRVKLSRTWLVRWLRLRVRYHLDVRSLLRRQLQHKAAPSVVPKTIRVLAPLIETSHYRFYHYLLFAKALQLRGADVKVVLCGSLLPGCELKSARTPKTDPCMGCRYHRNAVVPQFGLDYVDLHEVVPQETLRRIRDVAGELSARLPTRFEYRGLDIIPIVRDSTVRYFYGATPPQGSEEFRRICFDHVVSTMISIEACHALQERFDPQVVLSYMSVYSAWAPYGHLFARRGVPVINLSSTQYDYATVNVNALELYFSKDRFERYRASRATASLTETERTELARVLDERFSGRARVFSSLGFFAADGSAAGALNVDPSKRNIFLFSNIFWDVGLSEMAKLFDGVIDWVLRTIELVAGDQRCHLYIKTHPGEKFDSAPSMKGIVDYVRERYPQLPANVSLITPEMKLKPYDLAAFADLAVVYSGTLGVEMMLHGVPVVACGLSPYGGPGLALEPRDVGEYRRVLLGESPTPRPDAVELEMFAYFFFVKLQIPWTLTKQVYADDDFHGYAIDSLDDLHPGRDRYLDHLCNCVLHSQSTVAEAW